MVRLNADLIRKSSRFFKNSGEHVLDLKGNKITCIENLVATEERIEASKLFASEEAENEAQKESAAIVNSQTPKEAATLENALKSCQVQAAILTKYINAMNKNATDGGKEGAHDGPTYMEQNSMEGDLVGDSLVNQPEFERVRQRPLTKEEILSLNNHSVTFEYAQSLFDVDMPTFKAKLLEFGILVWNEPHGLGTFSVVKSMLEVDLMLTPGRYKLSYEKPEISVYEPLVTDLDWHEAVEYSKVRGYRLRLNVESDDVCFVLLKNAYDYETAILNQHDDGETYDEYASDPSNMVTSESDMAPYSSELMIKSFGDLVYRGIGRKDEGVKMYKEFVVLSGPSTSERPFTTTTRKRPSNVANDGNGHAKKKKAPTSSSVGGTVTSQKRNVATRSRPRNTKASGSGAQKSKAGGGRAQKSKAVGGGAQKKKNNGKDMLG
ncbi:hypothetical protein Tco_0015088 [Tanacetum coccineum]